MRRVVDQMLIGHKAQVIVPMWNLLLSTGIDDIHLRGDLIARAQPGLAYDGEGVVGVVVGEHLRVVKRELLRGIPDPVVGTGLAEVVTGGIAGGTLRVDD